VKQNLKRVLNVKFYRATPSGREPVREWLKTLPKESTKIIGEDIMTVQLSWPTGMPLVKHVGSKLLELRSTVPSGIARIFFYCQRG
jgi:hypothetical protein